jgi:hypothetical protein
VDHSQLPAALDPDLPRLGVGGGQYRLDPDHLVTQLLRLVLFVDDPLLLSDEGGRGGAGGEHSGRDPGCGPRPAGGARGLHLAEPARPPGPGLADQRGLAQHVLA